MRPHFERGCAPHERDAHRLGCHLAQRTLKQQFERRRVGRIADERIREPQADAIERTGCRHAHVLKTDARLALHGGVRAGRDDFQCGGHATIVSQGTR